MLLIGIDPGVVTGYAIWRTTPAELVAAESWSILQAMRLIGSTKDDIGLVIVEDARKRKWFGHMDREQGKYGAGVREGVGSVKRDCAIWEEFLTSLGVPFELRYPSATKMKADPFKRLTGWTSQTNEHARDAAMIVFGINESMARAKVIAFNDGAERARRDHSSSSPRPALRHVNSASGPAEAKPYDVRGADPLARD